MGGREREAVVVWTRRRGRGRGRGRGLGFGAWAWGSRTWPSSSFVRKGGGEARQGWQVGRGRRRGMRAGQGFVIGGAAPAALVRCAGAAAAAGQWRARAGLPRALWAAAARCGQARQQIAFPFFLRFPLVFRPPRALSVCLSVAAAETRADASSRADGRNDETAACGRLFLSCLLFVDSSRRRWGDGGMEGGPALAAS